MVDKELKPDQWERRQLERIVWFPATHTLVSEEKELLWKFRFYLKDEPQVREFCAGRFGFTDLNGVVKFLTKFVRVVDWSHSKERKQARELLKEWKRIQVDDALDLLSSGMFWIMAFSFIDCFSYPILTDIFLHSLHWPD